MEFVRSYTCVLHMGINSSHNNNSLCTLEGHTVEDEACVEFQRQLHSVKHWSGIPTGLEWVLQRRKTVTSKVELSSAP
jgi:hypothetical protein